MMTIDQFKYLVHKIMVDNLEVDTVTIYIPDRWTLGAEYRLFWKDGIEDDAPMYGPVHPKDTEERLLGKPRRVWAISNINLNLVFKDSSFAQRESIKSLVRYHLLTAPPHSPKKPGGILFLSYRYEQRFEVDYLARLEIAVSMIEAMVEKLAETPILEPKILDQQTTWLAQIARETRDIMREAQVNDVIKHVLHSALSVTGVGDHGYCCIHLVQSDGIHISCAYRAWRGQFYTTSGGEVNIRTGQGITTKVAREERSLLFKNITEACQRWPKRYSYTLNPDVKQIKMNSELAVPMYAKGRLIGVLNIEAPDKAVFSPEHVRIMEVLADNAAIAIIQSKFNEQLNRIVESAAEVDPAQNLYKVIERIKRQVAKQMGADDSDFWRYRKGRFDSPVHGLSARPRSKQQDGKSGISEWLLTHGQKCKPLVKAVLVTEMNHQTKSCRLAVVTREHDTLTVQPIQERKKLNPGMDKNTFAEVGLPLIFREEPLGILWVKWHSNHVFTEEELRLLDRYAYQCSLAFRIASIVRDPLEETFKRILRNVFGDARAAYFASQQQLLEPVFLSDVTIMFADIRASTEVLRILYAALKPEAFSKVIKDFYEQATIIVHTHGGILAKFLGDGIMAIFGAANMQEEPTDRKFYAQQAALAALELAEYFEKKLPSWKKYISDNANGAAVPEKFGLGIGLHTDSALVGNLALGEGVDFTAVGRAPTIASRIEGKARAVELKELWPHKDSPPGPVIVLCSSFMEKCFSGLKVTPLLETVILPGLEGKFNLGILQRSSTSGECEAR